MYTPTFLLALGLAAQQVSAGGWGDSQAYSCPGNTPTTCSSQQSGGFSWGGINPGQSVSSYGGCGFKGTTCSATGPGGSFGGKWKRDGHQLQDKCVTGKISGSKDECPSISAGQGEGAGQHFSPTSYGVSCSYDTQVQFQYDMPDGSTCQHTSPCKQGGNVVQNTQCGGAKSVTCSQHPSEKGKGDCSIGFHSVGFHCGSATTIVPPPNSPPTHAPPPPAKHTTPAAPPPAQHTTPAAPPPSEHTTPAAPPPSDHTTPAVPPPSEHTTPAAPPPSVHTTPVVVPPPSDHTTDSVHTDSTTTPAATTSTPVTTTFMSMSTVFITSEITVISCAPDITDCPARSKTPMVVTKTISQFTTECPVTATMIHGQSTMDTAKPSSTPDVSHPAASSSAVAPPASKSDVSSAKPSDTTPAATSTPAAAPSSKPADSSSAAPPAQSSLAPMPPGCPTVVPSCINTLLQAVQTECSNNGDSSCFCSVANHTMFVQECITAHGADAAEIQSALSFFQGLCAPQIPKNPSIVTHQPGGAPQQPSCPKNVPGTTITVKYTTTVPCSAEKTMPAGTTPAAAHVTTTPAAAAPSPSMTMITTQSVITVPQVQITTPPAAPGATTTPAMALVPGSPSTTAVPVAPPAYGAASSQPPAAPAATTTAAGSQAIVAASSTGPVSPPIQTAGAARMGVSFGAVAAAAVLLL